MRYTVTKTVKGILLKITGTYSYDKGLRTMPNGDPGWPPSEDVEIEKVEMVDGSDLLDLINSEIEERDILEEFIRG